MLVYLGFTVQKLNYIHNNPVEAGIVENPQEYHCIAVQGIITIRKIVGC
jgi:hypothetical protein